MTGPIFQKFGAAAPGGGAIGRQAMSRCDDGPMAATGGDGIWAALPFVSAPAANRAATGGSGGRSFWRVEASGDYEQDFALGCRLAELAVGHFGGRNQPYLLAWIVRDMMTAGRFGGIEAGFLRTVALRAGGGADGQGRPEGAEQ